MANSEHDIRIESDNSDDSDDSDTSFNNSKNSKIGTRAYRNTLEWRRRTRLKKCLMDIKTVVPSLQGKTASNIVIIENLNQYSREWKGRIRQMWQDIQKLQRKYNIPLKQLMTERLEARDRKLTSHVNEVNININLKDFEDTKTDFYSCS